MCVARDGALELDPTLDVDEPLESIEAYGMPNAYDVLERLVPQIQACLHGVARSTKMRTMVVGARVAKDGHVECALATGGDMPKEAACAAGVLVGAKFPPPRTAYGLVSVPISIR